MCAALEIFQALICWRGCCLPGPGYEAFRGTQQWEGWWLDQDLFAWHSIPPLQLSSQTLIWGSLRQERQEELRDAERRAASTRP